jgi:hypothetical protein
VRLGMMLGGSPEDLARAREQLRREHRLRIAMRSQIPELRRADIEPGRFGTVEHRDGTRYRVKRGEVDERHCGTAYYLDAAGDVVFLEELP